MCTLGTCEIGRPLLEQRQENLALAPEVMVYGALGEACERGDVVDGGSMVAFFRKAGDSGVEDLGSPGLLGDVLSYHWT